MLFINKINPRTPALAIPRLVFLVAFLLTSGVCQGQGLIEAEAIIGEPFGIGRVSIRFDERSMPVALGPRGVSLWEANKRILYPVVHTPPDNTIVKDMLLGSPLLEGGPVRRSVAGLLQGILNQPPQTTVYFLFRGRAPLDVTLQTRGVRRFRIVPHDQPQAHARLVNRWWQQLNARPGGLLQRQPDYPPIVTNYISSMLAMRLGLELPDMQKTTKSQNWWSQIEEHLSLFLGTENVLLAAERDRMLGLCPAGEKADRPLPRPMDWPPLAVPPAPADVKIEPIARRVPAECLYARFGSFANFLWMQDTLKKWGGDLSNLVALRGLDRESSQRMERQLVLKQTAMGRMLGPAFISDVAIIGTDMFMREGASYGLLFEARNTFLLDADFTRQRKERMKEDKSITEQTVEIAGRKVSYLSNPEGSVRSYYLADNGYLLVTTSRTIMRRFIETGLKDGANAAGEKTSLADTAEFRHARTVMPLARDDTVFVYLSDEFFRNMASPSYWIAMARRLQAAADIQLAELAVLAARAEGKPAATIDELIAGRFLPPGFQQRPGGNRTELLIPGLSMNFSTAKNPANPPAIGAFAAAQGALATSASIEGDRARDTLFGSMGSLLPIADVAITSVAPHETAAYERFLTFYREKWGRLDPMIVGIRRHELPDNRERVVIDAQANPFARSHFERVARHLGAADKSRIAPVRGDIMFIEAQLTDQRIFAGLQDVVMPFDIEGGRFVPGGGLFNTIVGYVGTTGRLGLLSILNQLITSPGNADGYASSETGLWRHQGENFTVFSFQSHVLAAVCPQLHFEEADRRAQIRVRIDDVARAQIAPALNALGYLRTRETSLGNILLMHQLSQQLGVPGPECQATANRLLDARLVCPLGGNYKYVGMPGGLGYWTSTALEADSHDAAGSANFLDVQVPSGYLSPPLNWFRGLEMDATLSQNALSAHGEIIMQMPEASLEEKNDTPLAKPPQPAKDPDQKPQQPAGGWLENLLPLSK